MNSDGKIVPLTSGMAETAEIKTERPCAAGPVGLTRPSRELESQRGDNMRDQPAKVQAGPAATTRPDQASLLGQVAWLMMQSPVHRHLFLADLEYRVAPPLMLQQFRLYRRDNVPVAFVSWALLTEEVEKRVQSGAWRLQRADWRAGDRLWVVDLVAPHGGLDAVLKDLRENVFPDCVFKIVRLPVNSGGPTVDEVKGVKVG